MPKKKKSGAAAKKSTRRTNSRRPKRATSPRSMRPLASSLKPRATRARKAPRKASPRKEAAGIAAPSANLGREYFQGKVALVDGSPIDPRGIGADAGGQSGDLQGLSEVEDVESESVEELVEEGQDYEAEIVAGIERAGDTPDAGVPRRERKNEFEPESEEEEIAETRRRGRPRSRSASKDLP